MVLDRDEIPTPVLLALEARAAGNSWKASAELGGIAITSLREWRKLKVVRDNLNEMVRETLAGATARLVEATPRIAEILIGVALDERSKPYNRIAAADLIFRAIGTHTCWRQTNRSKSLRFVNSWSSWRTVAPSLMCNSRHSLCC